MFDLEEALANQEIPDDATLTFKDKTISFGDLRGLSRKQQAALQTKIEAAAAKEQQVTQQQEQLLRLTQEAQQIHERLQAQESARPQPRGNDEEAWDSDPFYKPVREKTSKLEKRLEEMLAAQQKLQASLTQAATTWAEDRWDNEYNQIAAPKGKQKPKRDELLDFAVKNKIVDRHGMPTVRGAWEKMTEADRQKEIETTAYERGLQEGEQRARIASMPRPTTLSPNGGAKPNGAPLSDFDDLTARAMDDPELRAIIAGTNLNMS